MPVGAQGAQPEKKAKCGLRNAEVAQSRSTGLLGST
jgi:hypothetical protein